MKIDLLIKEKEDTITKLTSQIERAKIELSVLVSLRTSFARGTYNTQSNTKTSKPTIRKPRNYVPRVIEILKREARPMKIGEIVKMMGMPKTAYTTIMSTIRPHFLRGEVVRKVSPGTIEYIENSQVTSSI